MGDTFYIVGIALTALALVLSFFGLRSERFPTSRAAYAGVLGFMGALVVATCAFAVVLAREEKEHREEEAAHEAEQAAAQDEAETAAAEGVSEPGTSPAPADQDIEQEPPAAKPLELTSPAAGDLVFEPSSLDGSAGAVEIDYTNPSPVPHNVAIEADGEVIAEGETVTDGDVSTASGELEPGEYVFFCAVPGHREAGMEGTLTLK